jgi:hypothetical protein
MLPDPVPFGSYRFVVSFVDPILGELVYLDAIFGLRAHCQSTSRKSSCTFGVRNPPSGNPQHVAPETAGIMLRDRLPAFCAQSAQCLLCETPIIATEPYDILVIFKSITLSSSITLSRIFLLASSTTSTFHCDLNKIQLEFLPKSCDTYIVMVDLSNCFQDY